MYSGKHTGENGLVYCGIHAADKVAARAEARAAAKAAAKANARAAVEAAATEAAATEAAAARAQRLALLQATYYERLAIFRAALERIRALERLQALQRLRAAPVVFQRDPENGIDLVAFATDAQNVHRSSVVNVCKNAIDRLLLYPVPADQQTLTEVANALHKSKATKKTRLLVKEFENDYKSKQAYGFPYSRVADSVWAYIRTHEHKTDMIARLAQELYEGIGMCSSGKMARLINVLQGYDMTIEVPVPRAEIFQNKIAMIAKMPVGEREVAARALFAEFETPVAEQGAWLEPLLAD
jgi:uncharacterized Zn finger protein (UPF0148 family)